MKNLEQIKKLLANANEIKDLFERKIPMWKANKDTYDKTRFGFVEGGSDGWYKTCETNIHFGAWAGTYGDSSTYKQIDLDGDIFKKHFVNYLNRNKQEIMMAIAKQIEEEAKKLKDEAKKELDAELALLTELDTL